MFFIVTLIAGFLSFLYFYLVTKRKVDLAEQFPGPPTHFFVGNLFNFSFNNLIGIYYSNIQILFLE